MAYNIVQWKHFDNDDRRYEAYVLIDESDGAIIYNYQVWPGDFWLDILNDAIEDAREEQRHNKYGSYGVYGCINNEYDESTRVFIINGLNESIDDNDYIDKDGNHHRKFIDEDTGEEIDMIIDDEDFKNNHYEYDESFNMFDDDHQDPKIEELEDEYNDIVIELRDLKRRRKLLMIDMENDPDVINDLDGEVAQEYGLELGNIDEEIEKLQNRKKEIDKTKDIYYSDRDYNIVNHYNTNESIKLNKNDKLLLESLVNKYGKNTLMIKMRNIFNNK